MLNNDHAAFEAAQSRAAAAVSCESVVLPSGLTVLCRTMPGYSSVHAIYATGFGSIHRAFKLDGKQVTLPAGTADVTMLHTDDAWHGVTYHDDLPDVVAALRALRDAGKYPDNIW